MSKAALEVNLKLREKIGERGSRTGCGSLRLVGGFEAQVLVVDLRYIFAFEVSFFGDISQLFHHLFRVILAAGFTFAVAVVDAGVKLPEIELRPLDHQISPYEIAFKRFYSRNIFPLHAAQLPLIAARVL